jgi:aminoglycoside phosphotransferase (APT) family kinase protein
MVPGPLAEQWFVSGLNALGLEEAVRRHVVFLRGCGEMLRALHAVDTRSFADVLMGAGASVIHADPGPYNVIADPESGEVRALIDWELARIGDPIEDLALVEWSEAGAAATHGGVPGALLTVPDQKVPKSTSTKRLVN